MSGIPRWLLVVLGVSLALNLFFAGAWAGRRFAHPSAPPAHAEQLGVRGFLRRAGLDEKDPAVQQIVRSHREDIRSRMRAVGQARAGVREALMAEPYGRRQDRPNDPREQQRQFALDKRDMLPRYCRECNVQFACTAAAPRTA